MNSLSFPSRRARDLTSMLDAAYAAATKEWREAEEADGEYHQALQKTRAAGQLQQELVAFRETLMTVSWSGEIQRSGCKGLRRLKKVPRRRARVRSHRARSRRCARCCVKATGSGLEVVQGPSQGARLRLRGATPRGSWCGGGKAVVTGVEPVVRRGRGRWSAGSGAWCDEVVPMVGGAAVPVRRRGERWSARPVPWCAGARDEGRRVGAKGMAWRGGKTTGRAPVSKRLLELVLEVKRQWIRTCFTSIWSACSKS